MDSRFEFINFFIDNQVPIIFDKDIDTKYKKLKLFWEELNYKIKTSRENTNSGYIYFYKNRFVKNKLKANEKEYICIPSLDNPRWIIKNDKNIIKNHGLIIKPTSTKAKIIWKLAKSLNNISLFTLIFPYRILLKKSSIEKITSSNKELTAAIIYTGAIGKFQKFTLQFIDENYKTVNFLKVATKKDAILRIKNEELALDFFNSQTFKYINIPTLIKTANNNNFYGIVQNNIIQKNNMTLEFTPLDISAINELYLKSKIYEQTIGEYFLQLTKQINISELLIEDNFLEKIKYKKIIFAMSHGDYIPWNRFIESEKIKIIDWEMFAYRPIFYDIYFYLIHKSILIDNKETIQIFDEALNICSKINSFKINNEMKIIYFFLISLELYIHYKKNDEENDKDILNNLNKNINFLKKIINKGFLNEDTSN